MVAARGYVRSTAGGIIAAAMAGALWWNAYGKPALLQQPQQGETTHASVARVIDGDTFVAHDKQGNDLGRVRILGMDAPELARDGQPAMCGATEAKEELARLLEDRDVELVADPQQPDRDRYGRLLRYVDVGPTDVTASLIRSGHAPNTSRAHTHNRFDAYAAAQEDAQQHQRGLWSQCR